VSKLQDFFRKLGQGNRNTSQPSGSGRRDQSSRVQEWHKFPRLLKCKRGSSDGMTARLLYAAAIRAGLCVGRQRHTASGGGFAVAWRTSSGHNVRGFHCYEKFW